MLDGGGGGLYAATENRTRLYNEALIVNNDAEYSERKAKEWRKRNYEFQTYKYYICVIFSVLLGAFHRFRWV